MIERLKTKIPTYAHSHTHNHMSIKKTLASKKTVYHINGICSRSLRQHSRQQWKDEEIKKSCSISQEIHKQSKRVEKNDYDFAILIENWIKAAEKHIFLAVFCSFPLLSNEQWAHAILF